MAFCLSAVPPPIRLFKHPTRPPESKTTHKMKTNASSCTFPPKPILFGHQLGLQPSNATLCQKPEPPHNCLTDPPEPPFPPDLPVATPPHRPLLLPEPPVPPKPPDPPDPSPSTNKSSTNHFKTQMSLHPNSIHSTTSVSSVSPLKVQPLSPPSTLTPATPSSARRSMPLIMTLVHQLHPTRPSTRTPASTPHLVQPSTMTPANSLHIALPSTRTPASPTNIERLSMTKNSTYGTNNNMLILRRVFIADKVHSHMVDTLLDSFDVASAIEIYGNGLNNRPFSTWRDPYRQPSPSWRNV